MVVMNLSDPIESLQYIGPSYATKLANLNIRTVGDLIHHIPFRFIDFRKTSKIHSLNSEEFVTVKGEITEAKNYYTKQARKVQTFTLSDDTGSIEVIFFNQPFILNALKVGTNLTVAGQVSWYGRKKAIISPEYEIFSFGIHTGRLLPIYHETKGISSKWIRKRLSEIFAKEIEFKEFLPPEVLKAEKLIGFKDAVLKVHTPIEDADFELGKKRLAFNELLFMHMAVLERRKKWQKNEASFKLPTTKKTLKEFIHSLPFSLTNSQDIAIKELIGDLAKATPMNRLLEGDVGSGKTVVAATGCFVSFVNGYQSIIMAPTQILAQQHFNTLKELFEPFDVAVTLITSQTKKTIVGETDIYVGTHALMHQELDLTNVAFIVIDEQHRFGVEQRNMLVKKTGKKNVVPHVLTMTATPIPRTIAMSFYGDLDLSVLKEIPKDRQKITTWIVPEEKRNGAYTWIGEQIAKEEIQVYIVCPLIEESESETLTQVKAAKAEFETLQKVFKNYKLGILHGRQTAKEKNAVLDGFKAGEIAILVTTPVVEVGIDVPNATIMLIEASERFGLAQLHQLRGRVGRGSKKSYCMVMTQSQSQKVIDRLNALRQTHSGFELSELDLKMRGPGEIFGTKQSGFPELKIASWQDTDLIIATRKVAEDLVKSDHHDTITKKETY